MTRRAWIALGFVIAACASDGTSTGGSAGFYGDWYYLDDAWYGGGCCVNPPDEIGPPHPENPIVIPPGSDPRPMQPIASPPTPSPRPVATPRMSGGGGRGRR
jgi:hypothetical protein